MKFTLSSLALVFGLSLSFSPALADPDPIMPESENRDMYETFTRAKVYSEHCGSLFRLYEMSMIEKMMAGLAMDQSGDDLNSYRIDLRKSIEAETYFSECSTDAPDFLGWQGILLDPVFRNLVFLTEDEAWAEQPDFLHAAADDLFQLMIDRYHYSDGERTKAIARQTRDDAETYESALTFLKPFLKDLHFENRLADKGYTLFPREPVLKSEAYWAMFAIQPQADDALYPGFFSYSLSEMSLHSRILSLSLKTPVMTLDGATFDGRIQIIAVRDNPAGIPHTPNTATLLVQEQANVLARYDDDWRMNTMRFEGEITSGAECPGDFCITFPVAASDAVIERENGPDGGRFAYELFVASWGVGSIPDISASADREDYRGWLSLPDLREDRYDE